MPMLNTIILSNESRYYRAILAQSTRGHVFLLLIKKLW